jgi:hypothetical protein
LSRSFWAAVLLALMVISSACQQHSGASPIMNNEVQNVLKEVPADLKSAIRLPAHLPFKPVRISAFYSSQSQSFEQIYEENQHHLVHVRIGKGTSAFANREKIRLKNGVDAFYEPKGILYWNDHKNNVHFVFSSIDHSEGKKYQLSKEELAALAAEFVPLEE